MPSVAVLIYRTSRYTKLSFVHYTRQFPWCAVRPARNFGASAFFRAPGVSARFYRMPNISSDSSHNFYFFRFLSLSLFLTGEQDCTHVRS